MEVCKYEMKARSADGKIPSARDHQNSSSIGYHSYHKCSLHITLFYEFILKSIRLPSDDRKLINDI